MGESVVGRVVFVPRGAWSDVLAANEQFVVDDLTTWKGHQYLTRTVHTPQSTITSGDGTQPGGPYSNSLFYSFSKGFEPTGLFWDQTRTYYPGELVFFGAATYAAVKQSFNYEPDKYPKFWFKMASGAMTWTGNFDTNNYYPTGQVVMYKGSCYLTNKGSGGHDPTSTKGLLDYELIAQGLWPRGVYTSTFTYTGGEIVRARAGIAQPTRGGSTFVMSDRGGVGAGSPPKSTAAWKEVCKGLNFAPIYSLGSRYYEEDILKFQGDIYYCASNPSTTGTPVSEPTHFIKILDQQFQAPVQFNKLNMPTKVRVRMNTAASAFDAVDWTTIHGENDYFDWVIFWQNNPDILRITPEQRAWHFPTYWRYGIPSAYQWQTNPGQPDTKGNVPFVPVAGPYTPNYVTKPAPP